MEFFCFVLIPRSSICIMHYEYRVYFYNSKEKVIKPANFSSGSKHTKKNHNVVRFWRRQVYFHSRKLNLKRKLINTKGEKYNILLFSPLFHSLFKNRSIYLTKHLGRKWFQSRNKFSNIGILLFSFNIRRHFAGHRGQLRLIKNLVNIV